MQTVPEADPDEESDIRRTRGEKSSIKLNSAQSLNKES
jgi:hypothetical protein